MNKIILLLSTLFLLFSCWAPDDCTWLPDVEMKERFEISSLERGINESWLWIFVLWIWAITMNSEPVYYVYEKLSDNSYKLKKIEWDVIIKEDTETNPYYEAWNYEWLKCIKKVKWETKVYNKNAFGILFKPLFKPRIKTLHVPKWTIRKTFNW